MNNVTTQDKGTVKFTLSGERVTLTGSTCWLGGEQAEVIYADGSVGFEHIEDLID